MLRYKLSQCALSQVHVNVQKLKSAPWFPIHPHQLDSAIAGKALSRVPTDDELLAAEAVMQWFANFLINEPVEAINRLLKDGTYKWDSLVESLSSQEFDFEKVCQIFVNHIVVTAIIQSDELDHLLPDPQPGQSDQK